MEPPVVVVIPYFQRQAGVLSRCLASIGEQTLRVAPRIVVVDDRSPRPATAELDALPSAVACRVQVVPGPGGGPGAARNAGIEFVKPGEIVTFVDSDDALAPDHLERLVAALASGYDIACTAHRTLGGSVSLADRRFPMEATTPDPHVADAVVADVRTVGAWDLATKIAVTCVATAADRVRPLRFEPSLRFAGEDTLFNLQLFTSASRVWISTRPTYFHGHGVNVHSGRQWGTPEYLDVLDDRLQFHVLASRLALTEADAAKRARARRALLEDYWPAAVHVALRGPRTALRRVAATTGAHPELLGSLPRAGLSMVRQKLAAR